MKNKIVPYLFSVLVLFSISATSFIHVKSLSDQEVQEIQIERKQDGTSVITFDKSQGYGFKFSTPSGWYPMTIPSTSEEIDNFRNIVKENELPLGEYQFNLLTVEDDEQKMVIFDLNPEHYQDNGIIAIVVGSLEIPEIIPDWSISVTKEIERLDEVKNIYIENKDNQQVGSIEFVLPPDTENDIYLYGKMIFFIRNGKLLIIGGATDNSEWSSDINSTIDSVFDSLEFEN
jgi:hypothetical protein